jgi:hypothetical protein
MLDDHFSKSPLKWILAGLGVLLLALLIFDAGIALGERRARPHPETPFSAYGMPLPHTFGEEGHGAVGTIASTSLPGSFTLTTRDDDTDTILIGPSTELEPQGTPTSTLLVPGSHVIIIGEPESNESIQATLIRVLPQ